MLPEGMQASTSMGERVWGLLRKLEAEHPFYASAIPPRGVEPGPGLRMSKRRGVQGYCSAAHRTDAWSMDALSVPPDEARCPLVGSDQERVHMHSGLLLSHENGRFCHL